MLDPPDVIRKKVKSAVTDSGSEVRRGDDKPGVTNLIDIMTVATGEPPEAIEARYDSGGYGQFKGDVAEAVVELLAPIQARYDGSPRRSGRARAPVGHGRREGARVARSDPARDVRPHGLRPPRVGGTHLFTTRPELRGTFGAVASTHWLASAAGMAVLERGGNAFDAAVAAGFVLQVVEPHLNGPGGDLPAVFWPASRGEPLVLCAQGVAPAAATIERVSAGWDTS